MKYTVWNYIGLIESFAIFLRFPLHTVQAYTRTAAAVACWLKLRSLTARILMEVQSESPKYTALLKVFIILLKIPYAYCASGLLVATKQIHSSPMNNISNWCRRQEISAAKTFFTRTHPILIRGSVARCRSLRLNWTKPLSHNVYLA